MATECIKNLPGSPLLDQGVRCPYVVGSRGEPECPCIELNSTLNCATSGTGGTIDGVLTMVGSTNVCKKQGYGWDFKSDTRYDSNNFVGGVTWTAGCGFYDNSPSCEPEIGDVSLGILKLSTLSLTVFVYYMKRKEQRKSPLR